jgi:hypothetical protein
MAKIPGRHKLAESTRRRRKKKERGILETKTTRRP